jgi:hypothetical protein
MSAATLTVRVVPLDDDDVEGVVDVRERLYEELLTFDTDCLEPVESGEVPDGTKGVVAVVSAFLVWVSGSSSVRAVVSGLRDWVSRTGYSVEITIGGDVLKVGRATAGQQEELIRAFLDRHAPAGS